MCDLYQKIELLCQENGIKIADLSRETGTTKSNFSDLKSGKIKSLSLDKLIKIADYF
jgi:DNA-binding Xre family transcriptional regulator